MKLVLDTKSFVDAVSWVGKALDSKDDKAYIALVVDADGQGFISHTSGTSFIKSEIKVNSVELEGDEEGVNLALAAQFVKRFAATLRDPQTPLTFSKDLNDERTSLTVTRPQENYTIPLLAARIGSQPKYEVLGTIDDGEYFDTVTKLAKLTDPVNAGMYPAIGTVDIKLNPEDKSVTVMATDRYALGEIVLPFVPNDKADFFKENKNILIAESSASLISPSKGKVDAVELIYDEKSNKFGYNFADGRLVLFSPSTADAIPYTAIKNKSENTVGSALLSIVEFRNAVGAVSNLAYDETSIIITIGKKGITVSDTKGSNSLRVSAEEIEGLDDVLTVRFTRSILNEALSPISTNRVKFKWKDASDPFIFEPVYDDGTSADNVFLLGIPEQD